MISKRSLAVAFAVALLAVSRRIIAACGSEVRCKTIGILGLTFKPNTDDMRDAPAISIIQTLIDAGAKVKAYDPEGVLAAREIITAIEYMDSTYDVAKCADCLAPVTEWNAFRSLDFAHLRPSLHCRHRTHKKRRSRRTLDRLHTTPQLPSNRANG